MEEGSVALTLSNQVMYRSLQGYCRQAVVAAKLKQQDFSAAPEMVCQQR
jgi:hypothetical protein